MFDVMWKDFQISVFSCFAVAGVCVFAARHNVMPLFPAAVLQTFSFLVMFFTALMLRNLIRREAIWAGVISVSCGYFALLLCLWGINDVGFVESVVSFHSSKDFFYIGLPYAVVGVAAVVLKKVY